MRKLAAITALTTLVLTGCATTEEAPTPSSSTTSASKTTSTKTPSSSTATPSPSTEPAAAPKQTQAPAAEIYVLECLPGTPGPSRMSDGSTQYTDYCANQPGAQTYRDAEAAAGWDPSKVPFANGGTCPAYKCGYGHDENGNPYPSSGELQFQHGCEQGYIEPSECAAAGY
ncbi:hypothetical protein cu1604 [Corynebacterium urealyticum DSM 7109]|uniref:Secreted protein n=1 Tax=Corynebacterium urealyticum (strain ATCC 43042 / DSM 7109) TaxID=504474 RepID=B1VII0_CORU7|nr:hypothetical protein cu1604 [Corynebacterium urealyticum DSM 7109]